MRAIPDSKLTTCTFGTTEFKGYMVLFVPGDWYVAYDKHMRYWMTFRNGTNQAHCAENKARALQKAGTEFPA